MGPIDTWFLADERLRRRRLGHRAEPLLLGSLIAVRPARVPSSDAHVPVQRAAVARRH